MQSLSGVLRLHRVIIAACMALVTSVGYAAPRTTLTVVARKGKSNPGGVIPGAPAGVSFGHAYVILSTPTNSGAREEMFGFYPRDNSGLAVIKGPGMLKAEYRCGINDDCHPSQRVAVLNAFSEVEASVTVPLTDQDRRMFFREIARWNERGYDLLSENCANFVGSVMTALGYPVPSNTTHPFPVGYVRALSPLVQSELARREAVVERDAAEARLRAIEEENRKKEAANRRTRAEVRKRKLLADGWVSCTCPDKHSQFGEVIENVRYHPATVGLCPR